MTVISMLIAVIKGSTRPLQPAPGSWWCRTQPQQPVFARVVAAVVDADDDVQCRRVLDRRGDDDAPHAAVEIILQLIGLEKLAGADFELPVPPCLPTGRLSRQMALNTAMVGARSARIRMFAEAIGAISADCSCPWGRRVGL